MTPNLRFRAIKMTDNTSDDKTDTQEIKTIDFEDLDFFSQDNI
jgi:hypothetical protein